MSYFKRCPNCGAHLDPGERCDCGDAPQDEANERCISRRHAVTADNDLYIQRRAPHDSRMASC